MDEASDASLDVFQIDPEILKRNKFMDEKYVKNIEEELFRALMHESDVTRVLECLQSSQPINFDTVNILGVTLLHILASNCYISDEDAVKILEAVCYHLERHPQDTVSWGLKDFNDNEFITVAAANQRLSQFYPLVCEMPYYGDKTTPIPLPTMWSWDWDALEVTHKACFNIEETRIIRASRSTGKLFTLAFQKNPDVEKIKCCVHDGADVMFKDNDYSSPILLRFAQYSNTACVLACLESEQSFEITSCHVTALNNYMSTNANISAADSERILSILASHIKHHLK